MRQGAYAWFTVGRCTQIPRGTGWRWGCVPCSFENAVARLRPEMRESAVHAVGGLDLRRVHTERGRTHPWVNRETLAVDICCQDARELVKHIDGE